MIWIWMGDAGLADTDLIPDYSILSDPDWVHATSGYIRCAANYQLVIDNLLDLSHVAFLHPLLGSESMSNGKLSVKEHGTTIQSDFWMSAIEAPPFFEPRFKAGSSIDHWLDMRWHAPSSLLLDFGATVVGAAREEGFQGWASHILTPESETTVHYFFSIGRLDGPGAASAAAKDHEAQRAIFSNEDKPMLEACQQLMGTTDLFSLKPVFLGGDAAAVRARRMIERLLAAEASGAATLSPQETLNQETQATDSESLTG
jgi:vanillate O-demethylase monooxygenase subunit